ncbi:alpha/beta hydrolase [Escherichia coli]
MSRPLGFRFGANVAVRLAYLESPRLKSGCLSWSSSSYPVE